MTLMPDAPSLVRLRKGVEDAPLFLFGGIDGDPNELAGVAARTHGPKAMIGVEFLQPRQ